MKPLQQGKSDDMEKVLRILFVEDSEDDTFLEINLIRKSGYEICYKQVETAQDMNNALKEKKWDIILSDYTLPHFNGLEALNLLKESGLDIPFIIISGTIGEEVAVEAMKAGAQDYIMKNNMQRLLPAIEREIQESKIRTERRLLEQKQQHAEAAKTVTEYLKNLISDMHVGVIVVNNDTEIEIINNEAIELLGLSEKQIAGKEMIPSGWEIQFEDGYIFNGFPELFKKVIHSGKPLRNNILSVYRPDKNSRVWLFADAVPQHDNTGELIQVVWIFVDRTERKNAVDALRKSETHYRQLIEMSPDAIAIHQEGKIVFINAAGANLFGVQNPNEMIGKPILDIVYPDYHKLVKQRVEKTLIGAKTPYVEEKFVKIDGSVFDVEVTAIPTIFNNKPATHVIVRDITARKRIEEEIKTKNKELVKLNQEKDKFFSIIAHDLRSPLCSLLGVTELLADKMLEIPSNNLQMVFNELNNSANNLYKLLENLLQWARIQQGLLPFNPQSLNLLKIVNDSIIVILNSAKKKCININYTIPDDLIISRY